MNNKTKIMLGLSVLTAGTLAAGATGTLAWFTTNKTATATYQKVTVVGTQGNLNVAIEGVTNGTGSTKDAGTAVTAEGGTISDVSSKDGLTFYQPDWKNQAGNDQKVNSVKPVSDKEGYFVQYLVNVSNASTEGTAIKASLSGLTITVTKEGQSAELAKWVRVAILPGATKKADKKFLEKGATDATLYQTDTTLNNYVDGTTLNDGLMTITQTTILEAKSTLETELPISDNLQPNKGNSATVGVAVWVEGTSATSQDAIKNAKISVALTFTATDVQ